MTREMCGNRGRLQTRRAISRDEARRYRVDYRPVDARGAGAPRLSDGCYRAAVSCLDDVIAHAEALKRKGKVVEGDGWLDRAERPLGTGDIAVRKQNGGTKSFGGTIAQNINILRCPSYFARDLFDRLFA